MQNDLSESAHQRKPVLYYGWIMVAVGFVTLGAAFGVWYSFSVFILAIVNDFGWSRAAASSIFSTFIFSHSLMNLVTGHLQDRYGPRVVIPLGAVVLAIALALTSQSRTLWHFSVSYGLFAGIGVSLIGFASHAVFIPRWFERKRGLAVGITMAGIGFGMLFIIPLVEQAITAFGWRTAYLLLAAMILLGVAPMNLLLSRRSPQDMNLRPDGDAEDGSSPIKRKMRRVKIVDEKWAGQSWTLKKAVRTKRFWYLGLSFFFISFAYQGTLLHSVSAMVDDGVTREKAAFFFGILGIAGSAGKIFLGYLSDIYGRERINALGIAIAIAGIVCLMNAGLSPVALPLMFALLFGMGYGAAAPLIPSMCADIFFGSSFGLIFGMITIGGGAGGAVGSLVAGLLRDLSGTYITPLAVSVAFLLVSCILIYLASPGKVRRMVMESSG